MPEVSPSFGAQEGRAWLSCVCDSTAATFWQLPWPGQRVVMGQLERNKVPAERSTAGTSHPSSHPCCASAAWEVPHGLGTPDPSADLSLRQELAPVCPSVLDGSRDTSAAAWSEPCLCLLLL